MRIAFVQLGAAFPALDLQIARFQGLNPTDYHIEENPTAFAAQRFIERLETLKARDELCLLSLDSLRCRAVDTARLIAQLLHRRIAINLYDAVQGVVRIDSETDPARILDLVVALDERQKAEDAPEPARAPESSQRLLSHDEIQEIRRLHRAGVTPRRIGLLFRRSPDCILAVLNKGKGRAAAVTAKPQRNSTLHQISAR
jgi:DNA invertase Pin-like site-specific DNA recombinase